MWINVVYLLNYANLQINIYTNSTLNSARPNKALYYVVAAFIGRMLWQLKQTTPNHNGKGWLLQDDNFVD
jgi:hypothetical protein